MAVIARRASLTYIKQQAAGEWHEGVIVFPSGDVVVRFVGSFWGSIDTTIESAYLSRVDVVRSCSPWRCFAPRNHLVVHYLGIDARPAVLSICDIDLQEDVAKVRFIFRVNLLSAVSEAPLAPLTGCSAHQRTEGRSQGSQGILSTLAS